MEILDNVLGDPAVWLWAFGSAVISAFSYWLFASSLAQVARSLVVGAASLVPLIIIIGSFFAVSASRGHSIAYAWNQFSAFFDIVVALSFVMFWLAGLFGAMISRFMLARRAKKRSQIDQVFE